MGINIHGARLLCHAKTLGVDYGRTATIARQRLSLSGASLSSVLRQFGYLSTRAEVDQILAGSEGYAEALLNYLSATQIESFDVSDYEGATHLHDFNDELPSKFDGRYSTVFDSGSLEHIFNVHTAIKNCMRMVCVGGHYICMLPANNFFGHGFYQFSPAFFYQALSEANGFEIQTVIAFEDAPNWRWEAADPNAPWYEVQSPLKLRERVTLVNNKPVSLIVVARRVADRQLFETWPQQSDYVARWTGAESVPPGEAAGASRSLLRQIAKRLLPQAVRAGIRKVSEPRPRPLGIGFERRFFRKLPVQGRGELSGFHRR